MLWFFKSKKPDLTLDLQNNEKEIKKLDDDIMRLKMSKDYFLNIISYYLKSIIAIATSILVFFESHLPKISTSYINFRLDLFLLWLFGYFLIIYGNLVIDYIYDRRIGSREHHRKLLLGVQKQKIEELKKATKFTETQEILKRFEDPPKPIAVKKHNHNSQITVLNPQTNDNNKSTFLDRVLDKIVGEEEFENKFALICARCHTHNGLCLPERVNDYIFKCRLCSYLNHGRDAISPTYSDSSKLGNKTGPNLIKPASAELDKTESNSNEAVDNISVTSAHSS
eukprot:NODE_185_length_15706_cov_0.275902.p4 type:complete len:282 gc:universal NODE_185_length_15706_cov_0.275902:7820-6975(-)